MTERSVLRRAVAGGGGLRNLQVHAVWLMVRWLHGEEELEPCLAHLPFGDMLADFARQAAAELRPEGLEQLPEGWMAQLESS